MYNKILTIVFCGFIGIFMLINVIKPAKEFSEMENRYLEQKPKFSKEALLDGTFTEKIEKYISDQFTFRDNMVSIKSTVETILGKKENNGIYLGKDGVLLSKFDTPDEERLQRNIDSIEKFAKSSNVDVFFGLVPSSAYVLSDYLPKNAPGFNEDVISDNQDIILDMANKQIKSAKNIDIKSKLLQHKNEYIFYKTDHHWTSLGAYYAYQQIANDMNIVSSDISKYKREIISKDFFGTYHSKSGYRNISPDTVEKFVDDSEFTTLIYEGEYPETGKMYNEEFLEKKDKYSYFFGGNFPTVRIINEDGEKNLLIIKDSYSNAIAPFFAENFANVYMQDLRFNKLSTTDFIIKNKIDQVLILYSTANFSSDTNITFLK